MSERTRYLGERIPGADWSSFRKRSSSVGRRPRSALCRDRSFRRAVCAPRSHPIACSRRCSSQTSSRRRRRRPSSGTSDGTRCLRNTTGLVRAQLARFRGREIDATGDGMLATFDGPARAVRCAAAIVRSVREIGLEVRTGVHTGEIQQTVRRGGHSRPHRGPSHGGSLAKRSPRLEHGEGHRCGIGYRVRGARRTRAEGVPDRVRLYAATPVIRYSDDWLLRSSPTKCRGRAGHGDTAHEQGTARSSSAAGSSSR